MILGIAIEGDEILPIPEEHPSAAESITDFQCSVCLLPANMSLPDHDPIQAAFLVRAEGGKWVRFRDPISYEGSLPGSTTAADLKN